jgi:hypothetical protein
MTRLLRNAALTTVLMVSTPVWAQTPTTADDLNRQELNRLANTQQPRWTAPPNMVVDDPVGLMVAQGIRPTPPPFPGLLTVAGVAVAGVASVLDTVLLGGPSQY